MVGRDLFYSTRCGAGARAAEHFTMLSRRWRRRALRVHRTVAMLLAAPLLIGAVVERHLLSWALGVVIGALVALWVWIADSPPPHIEQWRTGARGERRTASALAPLRRLGYVLVHDIPDSRVDRPGGNVDHVVIGPGGVFLLDSKWLGGDASVDGDVVRVQRKDDPDDSYALERLAGSVRGKAVALKQDLAHAGVRWVQGVVVFWNDFEAEVAEANNVYYLSGERLRDWLVARPRVLSDDAVQRAADAMRDARPPKPLSTLRRWIIAWGS